MKKQEASVENFVGVGFVWAVRAKERDGNPKQEREKQ